MNASGDPTAEGVPGILNPDRLEQAGVPGAVVDLEGDGVEEARARAEDEVDGGAGDPCLSSEVASLTGSSARIAASMRSASAGDATLTSATAFAAGATTLGRSPPSMRRTFTVDPRSRL